ncbi:MAG: M1 family metallopeptidase [Planctomycetota bacterium]|nr:M1 family metallopeptidase [Planctomycetota bacterium]
MQPEKNADPDRFRQLDELLPTPGRVRSASGAPGPDYWQQKVDYDIEVTLDADLHRLIGSESITYYNNSPDTLEYLWVQMDQNRFREDSTGRLREPAPNLDGNQSIRWLQSIKDRKEFQGGVEVKRVEDSRERPLPHVIVDTMMRIDLEQPLKPGESYTFEIDWEANIVPHTIGGRGSYEWFPDTKNAIYEIARWFPRLCAYTDYAGWQNKQFLGRGEFTLEFGDYEVDITVPDTFVVASTGELQYPARVLTSQQQFRLREARTSDEPILVITPEEALANESLEATGEKTWSFKAVNVRDFAWAASPKFAWDAWGVPVPGSENVTMAMSFFPNEGEPLWSRYSTHAVAQTVEVYSEVAFPYPYPVAISVNGPVGGMEYPMICFNGPRPEEDGTYTERTKYGLISVIIHEVGHNWFPMMINSDERQWTWMDEGLNTFCQFLTQERWEEDYPSRRGEPDRITGYMRSFGQVPIMTNSESILQFGNNAYAKPATAMNLLRETVLGRELFDHAFSLYASRWSFKRPEPADLFRTMEDASGIDLDWFWRGWFYTTDHVDIAVERIERFTPRTMDPDVDQPLDLAERDEEPESLTKQRNEGITRRTDLYPQLLDFYNEFDELEVTPGDRRRYQSFLEDLEHDEDQLLELPWTFNIVTFRNVGGLPMPLPLELTYDDDSTELITIPAEIWSQNKDKVSKMFVRERPIVQVKLDPHLQIADAYASNNMYPQDIEDRRFGITKSTRGRNPMQRSKGETSRDQADEVVQAVAGSLPARWLIKESGSPVDHADALMNDAAVSDLADPWGAPMTIEFSAVATREDEQGTTEFCRVRSIGPDGEPGTDDDLLWVIYLDGTVAGKD